MPCVCGDHREDSSARRNTVILSRTTLPSGSAYDYERRAQVCGIKGEIGKAERYHRPWRHGGGGPTALWDLVNWRQMVQAAVTRTGVQRQRLSAQSCYTRRTACECTLSMRRIRVSGTGSRPIEVVRSRFSGTDRTFSRCRMSDIANSCTADGWLTANVPAMPHRYCR